MAENKTQILTVSVRTREKVLFEGSANTVTSFNHRGKFDVLPEHTNFITLISRYVIIDQGTDTESQLDLEKGILYVMSNHVNVYVGI